MWLYLCFIFSAESFTDIIIFYLLVCLSVRLLFLLSCAGSFCLFTFIFPFYWFLFSGVLVFPPGYVDVDSQFACPSTFRCASLYLHVCFVLYLSLVVLSFAFWLYIYCSVLYTDSEPPEHLIQLSIHFEQCRGRRSKGGIPLYK